MNSLELLCFLTEGQVDRLFLAARALPADKLDWKPAPAARSALDQLQEVATAVPQFWAAFTERKIEWDEQKFAQWQESRSKITTLDELERITRESTKQLTDRMKTVDEADLALPVDMPFPGKFTLADIFAYHYWNMGYHEGQINYIGNLLS